MGFMAKENTLVGVEIEDSEGAYKAPVDGNSFLMVLADSNELIGAKETKERNILQNNIGQITPRVGMRSASGTVGVEFKANGTQGAAPEMDAFLMSALGTKRTLSGEVTSQTGHTASKIYLSDVDVAKFSLYDIVLVKEDDAFHTSPIKAIDTTPGSAYIELLLAAAAPFSDSVVIAKFTSYRPANSGHKTLSVTKYLESKIIEKAWGMRATGMALGNFTTGGIADMKFTLDGMDFEQAVGTPGSTPIFKTALPPLILKACVYQDGVAIPINDLAFNIENSIGWATSTCSESGRISSRLTSRKITGTINPYKADDNVENFTRFRNNVPFSLFFLALNPTDTTGEYKDVVACFFPNCITTELKDGDKDGIITDEVSFMADRGTAGDIDEMIFSFI